MEATERSTYKLLDQLGLLNQVTVGKNSSGYTSGEPEIMLPRAATAAPAMIPIPILPGAPLAANDKHVVLDINGQLLAFKIGTVADALALAITAADSPLWRGVSWIDLGDTEIVAQNSEVSATPGSGVWATANTFLLSRSGRYRITLQLAHSSNNSQASARLLWELPGARLVTASATVAATGSSSHPTFASASTLNMTVTVIAPVILLVQYKEDLGGTVYMQNCSVKGIAATATPTLHNAAL